MEAFYDSLTHGHIDLHNLTRGGAMAITKGQAELVRRVLCRCY
jgi:hypothetical protein